MRGVYSNINRFLSHNLRIAVGSSELTQDQITRMGVISRAALGRYLDGNGIPACDKLVFLSDVLGVPVEVLLGVRRAPGYWCRPSFVDERKGGGADWRDEPA